MPSEFLYDVFLSHSAKDETVVRPLAERLRQDGLKVWFDEFVLKPGDSIPAKIEEGLEHSLVLPLAHRMGERARRAGEGCMSAAASGSDWAQVQTRPEPPSLTPPPNPDPLNQERRCRPLWRDDVPDEACSGGIPLCQPRLTLIPCRRWN